MSTARAGPGGGGPPEEAVRGRGPGVQRRGPRAQRPEAAVHRGDTPVGHSVARAQRVPRGPGQGVAAARGGREGDQSGDGRTHEGQQGDQTADGGAQRRPARVQPDHERARHRAPGDGDTEHRSEPGLRQGHAL